MAKFCVEYLGNVSGQALVDEIQSWQSELDDDIIDNIIYETLDTVIDIIIEHEEG